MSGFQMRADVVICASTDDEKAAILAHPKEFGWIKMQQRWYKKTVMGTVWAILFYGLVPDNGEKG